jgi:hypothetical protein
MSLVVAFLAIWALVHGASAVVTILLRGVSSSSSLRISGSEVPPLFDGTTQFGGVFCEDESNVTLAAIASESLTSIADSGPGLGAPAGSFCESLTIVNGSIRAEGGSGSAGLGKSTTVNADRQKSKRCLMLSATKSRRVYLRD